MEDLLIIAFACGGVSFTITTTSIFLSFREWVSKIHPKLEELIHCPWCLNHYVSIAVVLGTGYYPVSDSGLLNVIITWFAIVSIGGIIHWILLRAYKPVMKIMMMRKFEKLQK